MTSDETWERPPLWQMARDRGAYAAWRARVTAWTAAHPELAKAWDEALEESSRMEQEAEQRRMRRACLRDAGVPPRIIEAHGKGLSTTTATEAVQAFLASGRAFLLLLGSPGCGKSVAAAQVLHHGGVFSRAVELSRLSAYDKEDRRIWQHATEARVLVLDDLGAELLHDAWRPMLDELVDTRYGARAKTVITSNLDKDGFKARYGERITDRIRHDGYVESCGNKSLRRPEPPAEMKREVAP